MLISENTLKWAMRFYPPLFFQRIWVKQFDAGFTGVEVKIAKSILNSNYNRSIFGGTIFSASDPFYALLFDQLLQRRGFKTRVWLKSAEIKYLRPGRSHLYFRIQLSEDQIEEAVTTLKTAGKFVKAFPMEIKNGDGEVCATVMNEVYIRNLFKGEEDTVAY
ncbi:YiiD C-terminal domain-containing protein [Daejeonella oryzae]|uniref:YiiD C-terminal domain-containing protein n=1 Tax=Daejeonella oryzae TaxID=1122943 RepID=UPI00040C3A32|nr:YiiD C-terminal domain-containing protein [Daejeonella oryzae]